MIHCCVLRIQRMVMGVSFTAVYLCAFGELGASLYAVLVLVILLPMLILRLALPSLNKKTRSAPLMPRTRMPKPAPSPRKSARARTRKQSQIRKRSSSSSNKLHIPQQQHGGMPYSQMMMQPGTGGMPPFGHPYAAAAFMGGGGPPFSYPPGFGAAGFVPPHSNSGSKKGESGSGGESSSSPKAGGGSDGGGSGGNFAYPSPMFAFPPFAFHPFAHFPKSSKTPGLRLAMQCDAEQLSEYQMAIRQHLELFEAGPEDVESNTQGRKRSVRLGQVGLRCRHCSGAPLRTRGRGAVYYPAKLAGIYQVRSLFRLSSSPVVALARCSLLELLETLCWLTQCFRPPFLSY